MGRLRHRRRVRACERRARRSSLGCGNFGCWEQNASGNALVRKARLLASRDRLAARKLLSLGDASPDGITGIHVTQAARDWRPGGVGRVRRHRGVAGTGTGRHRRPSRPGHVRHRRRGLRGGGTAADPRSAALPLRSPGRRTVRWRRSCARNSSTTRGSSARRTWPGRPTEGQSVDQDDCRPARLGRPRPVLGARIPLISKTWKNSTSADSEFAGKQGGRGARSHVQADRGAEQRIQNDRGDIQGPDVHAEVAADRAVLVIERGGPAEGHDQPEPGVGDDVRGNAGPRSVCWPRVLGHGAAVDPHGTGDRRDPTGTAAARPQETVFPGVLRCWPPRGDTGEWRVVRGLVRDRSRWPPSEHPMPTVSG